MGFDERWQKALLDLKSAFLRHLEENTIQSKADLDTQCGEFAHFVKLNQGALRSRSEAARLIDRWNVFVRSVRSDANVRSSVGDLLDSIDDAIGASASGSTSTQSLTYKVAKWIGAVVSAGIIAVVSATLVDKFAPTPGPSGELLRQLGTELPDSVTEFKKRYASAFKGSPRPASEVNHEVNDLRSKIYGLLTEYLATPRLDSESKDEAKWLQANLRDIGVCAYYGDPAKTRGAQDGLCASSLNRKELANHYYRARLRLLGE